MRGRQRTGWHDRSVIAESDLTVLLASMDPELRSGRFVFGTASSYASLGGIEALATVVEPEGLSMVVTQEAADRANLPYSFVAGWITLRVHSSLHAVGLTAAVSTALAEAGISCNVIAGYHHDHLLVPVDRAGEAMDTLRQLSAAARTELSR